MAGGGAAETLERVSWPVESSWNMMVYADAREEKWRGNWRMEWVASTLYNSSEHGVSNITTADAHTSAASSPLNWRPRRFKWTCPFRRKTESGFFACAITFQMQSTMLQPLYLQKVPDKHCTAGWVCLGDGLECAEEFDAASIRPPDCPTRSMSLYRLSYPDRAEFCAFYNILR